MNRNLVKTCWALLATIQIMSCSGASRNGLRADLDNPDYAPQESLYGKFPERGYLDREASSGRRPASVDSRVEYDSRPSQWIGSDEYGANQRDKQRPISPTEELEGQSRLQQNKRVTREDFIDDHPSEGSLWASTGQTNYFFTKNRIKGLGDLVTITMDDALISNAATELKKTMTPDDIEMEIKLIKDKRQAEAEKAKAASRTTASASDKEKDKRPDVDKKEPEVTINDIDVKGQMQIAAGQPMMGEIIERYPNGNYKIRASKRVPYKGTYRMLYLVGIARANDLSEEDVVEAGKLYEYRLKVTK